MKSESDVSDDEAGWFAFKVGALGLVVNYFLGPWPVVIFVTGWLWGCRRRDGEE